MTNEVFSLLSEEEKQTKFKAVLRNKTQGLLTSDELEMLISDVPLGKQYEIRIYNNPYEFMNCLTLADSRYSRIIFGGIIAGCPGISEITFNAMRVAAFLTVKETDIVHIYIPGGPNTKGCEDYEKQRT